jgi:AP endonuclease-1
MSSDSSLSPPPSEEILNAQAAVTTVQTEVIDGNGRKRKAETTTKTTKRAKTAAVKEEVPNGDDIPEPPKGRKRTTKVKVQKETMENEIAVEGEAANGTTEETPKRRKRATKVKVEAEVTLDENGEEVKVKKKRQKKPKPEDIPPLEPRTMDSKLRVGAHVSIAGGNASTQVPPLS